MSAGPFCILTRILRVNTHGFKRFINSNVGQVPNAYARRKFCTEVTAGSGVSQYVQPAALAQTQRQKKIREVDKAPVNISDYADRVPLLQDLIDLGVEIYKFNDDQNLCKFLITLDFENNIRPYLTFLHENGVPVDKFGEYLTRNPYILQCDLDDLQVRINYLESKKFTKEMIAQIITQHPKWLSFNVVHIDARLGEVQTALELTGDEVRTLAVKFPRVASLKLDQLRLNLFTFKEEFGLDMREVKKLLLQEPALLRYDNKSLLDTLEYLIWNMSVPIHQIVDQPSVLKCRVHVLKMRHMFLQRLGRAQYNPKMPGYVSLADLVSINDDEFCNRIARTSITNYNNFIKTL